VRPELRLLVVTDTPYTDVVLRCVPATRTTQYIDPVWVTTSSTWPMGKVPMSK
jgi:hypothetical protein